MSRNIAVVEDDRDLGKLICTRLEGAGYQCSYLANSEKAFAVLKEKKPDLIILDVMMPKVNGYELCRHIRRDPLIYLTPVLMLSALGGEPEMAHALEQGADDYLMKPFDVGVLFARVKTLLEKHARIMQKNQLTGLYGGEFVKKVIINKLFRDETVAACYFTLMHFAPYTKLYGPQKRDDATKLLADILKEVTHDTGVYECVIAHLGGPDFMVLLSIKDFERYCNEGVLRFRNRRNALYSAVDANRGAITVEMEGGGMADYPLMSVAVGVVTNEKMKFRDSSQMVKVAGEINRRAQLQQTNGHIEVVREGMLI
ncbi:MAG: response regulator [Candidatus Abyssobacteria bacterium SURF_17]|uniref:Response regulator n=1 Tax=Candidatus Abyssobacteria bacterium SURF_17 TaxID=2093361 RepID=A0A419F7R0_9BACT|nr:MAG: response regulator [Candidatus Abyssubacteria bacterium SURF_17]